MPLTPDTRHQTNRIAWACAGLLILLGLLGCKSWKNDEPKSHYQPFAKTKMPTDSMALEVVLVELPSAEMHELIGSLTPMLDRQKINLDERQQWDQNGLAVGVFKSNWPGELRQALEPRTVIPAGMDRFELTDEQKEKLTKAPPVLLHRKMQFRSGEPRVLPISDYVEHAQWQVFSATGSSTEEGQAARGWMQVISRLSKGSSVEIQLAPQVSYGPVQQHIGVIDRTLAFQSKQTEKIYSQIPARIPLSPGDTAVVFAESDPNDLGELLFGSANNPERDTRRILLLRLIQTQHDDLFEAATFR
jgi:hypothetical protein